MTKLKKWALPVLGLASLGFLFLADGRLRKPELTLFRTEETLMGTSVVIALFANSDDGSVRAMEAAFARMRQIESIASSYTPESELSFLNRSSFLSNASPELMEMLAAAKQVARDTSGAFDVSVEPLLSLWRYDPVETIQFWDLPDDKRSRAIAERLVFVGEEHIRIGASASSSVSLSPGTKLNLGGIAKGYAVDQGLLTLREHGIEHALINAGGDVGAMGGRADGTPWDIVLRHPEDDSRVVVTFQLNDGAIATSGNYLRFFDPNEEIGHILDPRTGNTSRASSSATVIAPSCMQADALATGVFVLGPHEGMRVIEELPETEALILDFDDPTQLTRSSGLASFESEERGYP